MHFRTIVGALLAALIIAPASAEESSQASLGGFEGNWFGAWVQGMSSGKMKLNLRGDTEEHSVVITGLAKFGEKPVGFSRSFVTAGEMRFAVTGENNLEVRFTFRFNESGRLLNVKGEFEGYRLAIELARTD